MQFIKGKYAYEKLIEKLPSPYITFHVDYSLENNDDYLGHLSPFIIDVEEDIITAIIKAEYNVKMPEKELEDLISSCFSPDENDELKIDIDDLRDKVSKSFSKIFELGIVAVNPKDMNDIQTKSLKELQELFPLFIIRAERNLDETGNKDMLSAW